jgi:DNA-binding NtrC family response regulator
VSEGEPVLVVDDDPDMGWAMRHLLRSAGRTAVIAETGADGLRLAAAGGFRVAFVDLKLTDADGLELTARLRAAHPGLACVLMSGYLYPDDDSVQAALADGRIAAFLAKPFLLTQLHDALARCAAVTGGSPPPG